MAKPYVASNMVVSTIAVGNTWTRGTDTSIVLTDGTDFDSGGGYIRIGTSTSYALMEYTGKTSNTLTGLTPCTLGNVVTAGDETKEWPAGTIVARYAVGEELADRDTLLSKTDFPSAYTDKAGYLLAVNDDEDEVEFVDKSEIDHLLRGAKSLLENIETETWNAEFHTTLQADNNTIGTIASGDAFEWIASPDDADINSSISHALFVKTSKNDAADGKLRIEIDPTDLAQYRAIYLLIYPPMLFSATSHEMVALRVENSTNSTWLEVRLENDGAKALRVKTYRETGETGVSDVFDVGTYCQEIWIAIESSNATAGLAWRAWLSAYRVGKKSWTRITSDLRLTDDDIPDRTYLLFGKSDDTAVDKLKYGVGYVRIGSEALY
jgi:hypothetical protein